VNCAAIPSGLLESELFGHEKGAFTGAIMRKPGRFELADKGTLFLDEVGDIPLELQAKLLRVLQEREFERLGSTRTQQVDVRVIGATHRDLKQMVEEGTFRSDLYYRLHVFPLAVPPLRARREDIPCLARHFVDKYSQRMHRHIETISPRTMEVLKDYAWPGKCAGVAELYRGRCNPFTRNLAARALGKIDARDSSGLTNPYRHSKRWSGSTCYAL
jgi:formate hydrogenlyase transcriptional activator